MILVTRPRGRRPSARFRAAVAAVAATASLGALAPGVAHAGTYPMYSCNVPGASTGTRGPWTIQANRSGTTRLSVFDNCASGGSFGLNTDPSTAEMNPATLGAVQLTRPAGFTISGITAWLTANTQEWTATPGSPAYFLTEVDGAMTHQWSPGLLTTTFVNDVQPSSSFQFQIYCGDNAGKPCYIGFPGEAPVLSISGIQTTLVDDLAPRVSIEGGTLTTTGAKKGTKSISVVGADDHSGVRRIDVLLDDIVVGTMDYSRDWSKPLAQQKAGTCTYDGWAACATNRTVNDFMVDTTQVPDGAYALAVRTTDAAGNRKMATVSDPVIIDNVPDQPAPAPVTPTTPTPDPVAPVPGPQGPTGSAGPAGANGANGSGAAVLHLNGANGTSGATINAAFASSKRRTIRSAYGKKVLITGQLVSPRGKPITGARLWVMQQAKMIGARVLPAGEVVTDRAGKFRYVTTAKLSQTIRFGYRTHLEDADFSATTDIALGVIASVKLTTSRKSLRNGQAVVFRGSVAGAPKRSRKVVELQVKKGKRWMTFRSTRLRNGRFNERYRFTRTRGRATYVFRARLRQEAGFPFLTGFSKQVRVTVRG